MASKSSSSPSSWKGSVLNKDNLEQYTAWLNELRDYVYSHGSLCGELMEHHLIGEPCEIPVVNGGPTYTEDDSQLVIGIDAGRRLQIHSAKSYDVTNRLPACQSYARRGLLCGDMPMRSATMSSAQLQRFTNDVDMQDALYQRRERFLWELLAHATGGAIREAIDALGPSASAYARVQKVFKSYSSLATSKKTALDAEWDHPEGACFKIPQINKKK